MLIKSKLRRVFSLFFLVSVLSAISFADTIRLKDGSIIKGNIVSFSRGSFVVEVGDGSRKRQFRYAAAEVESITFDRSATQAAKPVGQAAAYSRPEQKIVVPPPRVITTDPSPQTTAPQVKSPPPGTSTSARPIEWAKKVPADNTNNGWTNSGWVVKKGQKIRVTGDGVVSLGKGQTSTPTGIAEINDEQKLMKSVPTGALIAVIGDDNNDFIYIGAEREFTAARDGALFLGLNEGNLIDNSGAFDVTIQIIPDDGR
jgi:hypothetical protein